MKNSFKKLVTGYCLCSFFITAVIWPVRQTEAAVGQWPAAWSKQVTRSGALVNVPHDLTQSLGAVQFSNGRQNQIEVSLLQGERWVTLGQESVGMLGLDSDQVTSALGRLPSNEPVVFARYHPESAQLSIDAITVRKMPNGQVQVFRTSYTPHHGELMRQSMMWMEKWEKSLPNRAGRNPFQSFRKSNNDPVFYNINWAGTQVAVGWAMRHFRAPVAYVAVAQTRAEQNTQKSGGWFRKKITTTTQAFVKPIWYVALPRDVQPYGFAASICAEPQALCSKAEYVVPSMVNIDKWQGGNLPENEDLVYNNVQSKSGFTILSFALMVFVAAYGLGFLATNMAAGWTTMSAVQGGASTMGLTQLGAIAAGTYAGGSYFNGSGGSITQYQQGLLGATGNGILQAQVQQGLAEGIQNASRDRFVQNKLLPGLTGVRRMVSGDCPDYMTDSACRAAGLSSGAMPRADTYLEAHTPQLTKEALKTCREQGLSGKDLAKCASPSRAQSSFLD